MMDPSLSSTAMCVFRAVEPGNHSLRAGLGRKRLAVVRRGEQNCLFPGCDADHLHGGVEAEAGESPMPYGSEAAGRSRTAASCAAAAAQLAKRKIAQIEVGIDEIVDRAVPNSFAPWSLAHSTRATLFEKGRTASPRGKMLPHPCMHGNVDEGVLSFGHRQTTDGSLAR